MKKVSQSANKMKERSAAAAKKKEQAESTSKELVPADDASAVSALSFALSEGGSLEASAVGSVVGSVAGSLKSGVESELSILKNKYAGAVEKYKLETPTVIVFVSLYGALTEYPLNKRITTYMDLQREIARLQPKMHKMFVIQDISGAPISAKNFVGYDLVRVKEICIKPRMDMMKYMPINWEDTQYHVSVDENANQDDDISFMSRNSDFD